MLKNWSNYTKVCKLTPALKEKYLWRDTAVTSTMPSIAFCLFGYDLFVESVQTADKVNIECINQWFSPSVWKRQEYLQYGRQMLTQYWFMLQGPRRVLPCNAWSRTWYGSISLYWKPSSTSFEWPYLDGIQRKDCKYIVCRSCRSCLNEFPVQDNREKYLVCPLPTTCSLILPTTRSLI